MVTTSPGEMSVTCTCPLDKLPPGGILVRWEDDGFPGFHLPKPNITIGGRPLLSGRRDLNPGPSVPQTDTLTKLRHVPLRHDVVSVGACPPCPAGSVSLAQPRRLPETKAAPGHQACVIHAG